MYRTLRTFFVWKHFSKIAFMAYLLPSFVVFMNLHRKMFQFNFLPYNFPVILDIFKIESHILLALLMKFSVRRKLPEINYRIISFLADYLLYSSELVLFSMKYPNKWEKSFFQIFFHLQVEELRIKSWIV